MSNEKLRSSGVEVGSHTFDTPVGKQRRSLIAHKSEIDFLLGRDGGRPSAHALTIAKERDNNSLKK